MTSGHKEPTKPCGCRLRLSDNEQIAFCPFHDALHRMSKLVAQRVAVLTKAIESHRGERGHGRCWLDDVRLYATLPESIPFTEFVLPPKEEFLRECANYYDLRQPLGSGKPAYTALVCGTCDGLGTLPRHDMPGSVRDPCPDCKGQRLTRIAKLT